MKLLLFSNKIPFEEDYLSKQYQYLIENLVNNHTIYIALPFSDNQLILSDYDSLKKNGVELQKTYHNCFFLLYHKEISLNHLNQFFLTNKIDYFLSLFSFPNIKIDDSSPMFMTKSGIWLQPKSYQFDGLTLSKLALFHHLIVESDDLLEKIVKLYPRHLVTKYSPIPYPKELSYIKQDESSITKIVVNLNMENSYLLDTLLNVCQDYVDNKEYEIFLFSDNGYFKNKVHFSLSEDFKDNSIITLKSGFEDEEFTFQTGENHRIGGNYFTYHFTNLIDYFVKKKKIDGKNIKVAKINITRNEIISIIANCNKYIDLSLGNNFYDKLLIANSFEKDIVTIDYLGNKELISRGSVIIPKKIKLNEDEITLIDENPLQKHMFGKETKTLDIKNNKNIDQVLNINRFGLDFKVTQKYRDTIDILRKHKVQHLYVLGEIDYQMVLYWLSENPILKEVNIIVFDKSYNKEKCNTFIANKVWLQDNFHQKINVQVLFTGNTLKNNIKIKDNMMIIHSNEFLQKTKKLEEEQILKLFYQDIHGLNFYNMILQDKPNLTEYTQKKVTHKVFICDKKKVKYEIENIGCFDYKIDFFYSINEEDMKEMNNWYQEMVTSGYLDIKSNVRDTTEFLKFFRHYVLWEELCQYMDDTSVYEIQYIGEESQIKTNLESIRVPDLDITFIDKPLNLNHYIINKKGLEKLLKYSKPIKYLFEDQIKFSILSNGLLCHTITNDKEKEELKLKNIEIIKEKKVIKKTEITYIEYFSNFVGGWFDYFFGKWISKMQSYLLGKGLDIMLYLAKKEVKK